ncbi:MAG: transcriptional repressor LexA [Alphaproteobacteria bacterium]|nr:transcriptional repressor LexA [Alphaproteobacteria bacterium]
MLTRKQNELLLFINQRIKDGGVSPSFDEMKEALGLKSKSGIHRLITGLEERGFIRRLAHRARALEVLRLPETAAHHGNHGHKSADVHGFKPNVIKGQFKAAPRAVVAEAVSAVDLPLYGKIAAGNPIEALRDSNASVAVPASLLGRGEYYALQVDGDSMMEAGIFDGDTAIIERGDVADNGQVVVAVVDEDEVTLKRLRRKGDSVALEPANARYETRIFGPDRVKIQGRLVGLMRKY